MIKGVVSYTFKGMNQDLDPSAMDPSYAYEIKNMRILNKDNYYALVNEQGESLSYIGTSYTINRYGITDDIGTICYSVVIGNFMVLWTTSSNIYILKYGDIPSTNNILPDTKGYYICDKVYIPCNTTITKDTIIVALAVAENTTIYKVYFSIEHDNKYILIFNSDGLITNSIYTDTQFKVIDNIRIHTYNLNSAMINELYIDTVYKKDNYLASGIMQYFVRAYTKYGYASDFFWQSVVVNTDNTVPNSTSNCSYQIRIHTTPDYNVDFQVYVAYSSSEQLAPVVYDISNSLVKEEDGTSGYILNYTDTNQNRVIVDDVFTIAEVHNKYYYRASCNLKSVLFIGNVTTDNTYTNIAQLVPASTEGLRDTNTIKLLKPTIVDYATVYSPRTSLVTTNPDGIVEYSNRNLLNREHYRLGLQAMDASGIWSSVIYIKDYTVDVNIVDGISANIPSITWSGTAFNTYMKKLQSLGYVAVRPVIVFPKLEQRKVIVQGVCNPTVFRVRNRVDKESLWSQSSWIFRPMRLIGTNATAYSSTKGVDTGYVTTAGDNKLQRSTASNYVSQDRYRTASDFCGEFGMLNTNTSDVDNRYVPRIPTCTAEYRHLHVIPGNRHLNGEIVCNNEYDYSDAVINHTTELGTYMSETPDYPTTNKVVDSMFGVDSSVFTLHSPDVEYDDSITEDILATAKFRIVGFVPINTKYTDVSLQFSIQPETNMPDIYPDFKYGYALNHNAIGGYSTDTSSVYWMGHVYYDPVEGSAQDYYDSITCQSTENSYYSFTFNGNTVASQSSSNVPASGWDVISKDLKAGDTTLYPQFIFHKSGSYNNLRSESKVHYSDIDISSKAYYHYASNTYFLDNTSVWNADGATYIASNTGGVSTDTVQLNGIYAPKIFDTTSQYEYIRLGSNINRQYSGNIDTLLTDSYRLPVGQYEDDVQWYYDKWEEEYTIAKEAGNYNEATNKESVKNTAITQLVSSKNYRRLRPHFTSYTYINNTNLDTARLTKTVHSESVFMKYKTKRHYVIELKALDGNTTSYGLPMPAYTNSLAKVPYSYTSYRSFNDDSTVYSTNKHMTYLKNFDNNINKVIEPVIQDDYIFNQRYTTASYRSNGILWLGELYNSNATLGPNNSTYLASSVWHIAGKTLVISNIDFDNSSSYSRKTLNWTEGDTFYNRYDCLHTYPFTEDDTNKIVDVLSFMCNSRICTDGCYDTNRTPDRSIYSRPQNHSLLNKTFSNNITISSAQYLDTENTITTNDYSTSIFYSTQKLNGMLTDVWYNMGLSSQLELDGKYGPVYSIQSLGGYIFVFQKDCISKIYYNNKEVVTTDSGLPLTIANGTKVSDYDIVCYNTGTVSNESVINTGSVIYYYDDTRSSLFTFNGSQTTNISKSAGMSSWFEKHNDNYKLHYDYTNNEVYITSVDYCLVYNELLGTFTSFYDYTDIVKLHNYNNTLVYTKGRHILSLHTGMYNNKHVDYTVSLPESVAAPSYIDFYAVSQFYSKNYNRITVVKDVMFTDMDYIHEMYTPGTVNTRLVPDATFDTVSVSVPYTNASSTDVPIVYNKYGTTFSRAKLAGTHYQTYKSNAQRKFGIWHVELPRPYLTMTANEGSNKDVLAYSNRLNDRRSSKFTTNYLRYPYIKTRLTLNNNNHLKSILHSLQVNYYDSL